jgi:biotin carboxylase
MSSLAPREGHQGPDGRPDQRPLLIIIGTGGKEYREYLLRSIGREYRVHLFMGADPTWEREHITGWSIVNMAETMAADEMIVAARTVAETEPVQGILAWDEARIFQGAQVAAALGLPGGDPDLVMRCRDKHLTRQAMAAAGVPQPESVMVSTLEEALEAADRIGYPVVLKPRALAASLGVVRVDNADQLRDRYSFAHDTTVPGAWQYDAMLVEECLTGPEISIDAAVHHGHATPMFVARKHIGYPPYFEEVGHDVDASDPLLTDPEIVGLIQRVHDALGYGDGCTHSEFRLTPTGPKLVEVNGRLGGDLIPYLGLRATGIDPGLAAAAVACGRTPEVTADRKLVGSVRFVYIDRDDTTIEGVDIDRDSLPPTADRAVVLASPGDVVSPPPKGTLFGRIAFLTAVAETVAEAHAGLDAAQSAMRIRTA